MAATRYRWALVGLARIALLLAVLYFVGQHVLLNWDRVGRVPLPNTWSFMLGTVFGFGAYALVCYCYRLILARHGFQIPYHRVVGLVYLPLLGKYVPGKVWSLLAALHLYDREGLPKRVAAASISLVMASALVSGGVVTLLFGFPLVSRHVVWWAYLVAIVGVFTLICPPVFYGACNTGLRLLDRQPIRERLSAKALLWVVTILVVSRVTIALGFFLLMNSFYHVGLAHLPSIIALFTLAQVAGFVALFAPAGIGVREGVLLIGLEGLLGTGPAIVVAGMCRVWQTVMELLMAAVGLAGLRYSSSLSATRTRKP